MTPLAGMTVIYIYMHPNTNSMKLVGNGGLWRLVVVGMKKPMKTNSRIVCYLRRHGCHQFRCSCDTCISMIKRTPGLLCVFPQPRKRNIVADVSGFPQPRKSKLNFTKARLVISKRNTICGFRNRYMWVICMLPSTYQQIKEDWWYVNNLSNMFLGHYLTNKEAKYNESGIVIGDFTSRKT